MFLTSSELILLHWNNLSSDASVQLPLFQSKYFLDASRFPIAPDHQLFVQYILLYTFPSIGKLGLYLPSSFTELLQSRSIIFFCLETVFIGRDKALFFLSHSIVCTIQVWYSQMLHNYVKKYTISIRTNFLFV